MPDENNDLNTDQVVTDQDLNNADAVDQQNLQDPPVQDQTQDVLADGTPKDKTVKYEELEKAVQGRKAAEEQAAHAQRQLDLISMNAQQQQVQTAPKSTSQQALDSLGITADDLFGENVVKYQEAVNQLNNAQTQQNNAVMQTQEFMMTHPDIASVVGSVNPMTGRIMQATPEIMALVQKKPYLRQASVQDLYLAVQDERKFSEYQKTATIQKEHQTRAGVKTETQPMGGSAAGGGGAGSQGSQNLMTREQVLDMERRLAAGEIIS